MGSYIKQMYVLFTVNYNPVNDNQRQLATCQSVACASDIHCCVPNNVTTFPTIC